MSEPRPTDPITQPESGHPASAGVHLPEPTIWPAAMAAGVSLILAGVILTPIFSIVGILLAAVALAGWIRELLHG